MAADLPLIQALNIQTHRQYVCSTWTLKVAIKHA